MNKEEYISKYGEIFNSVFKAANVPLKYYIDIDTYDEDCPCYCLLRKIGNNSEVLLIKTLNDKKQFDEEVNNLAKYFDASILKE